MVNFFLRLTAFLIIIVSSVIVTPAWSESTTLYVENKTPDYITVNVDGNYGCNTSSGSTCSIPVTVGKHKLHARRHDTGKTKKDEPSIPSSGYTWRPWSQ